MVNNFESKFQNENQPREKKVRMRKKLTEVCRLLCIHWYLLFGYRCCTMAGEEREGKKVNRNKEEKKTSSDNTYSGSALWRALAYRKTNAIIIPYIGFWHRFWVSADVINFIAVLCYGIERSLECFHSAKQKHHRSRAEFISEYGAVYVSPSPIT